MNANWTFIEEKSGYSFWKYVDEDDKTIYNATKNGQPPTTTMGYYSYAYVLRVKGLIKGDTITSLFRDAVKEQS